VSKHTPGPWHSCINASHTAFLIKDKAGRLIAMPSWHASNDTHFPLKEQSEANARLMAAAPELLEALIDLGDWLAYGLNKAEGAEPTAEDHAACERVAAQARAAIAKATGAA
jgi:type VI protein secretion system component VasF